MHIGILSQPSNFHCQKWAKALKKAGNQVTIFSLENFKINDIHCIHLNKNKKSWSYGDFYFSKNRLKEALKSEKIDILHPLHLTPYGVWGIWSEFQPIIPAAMGADVFEYLPNNVIPELNYRQWKNLTQNHHFFYQMKNFLLKKYHKKMVQKVLNKANFITADNQTLIDALIKYFNVPFQKLLLQRWGVEEEIFHTISENEFSYTFKKLGIHTEYPIILSPRGLMPIYQADIILNSFTQLVSQFNNFQFVMLSSGYPLPPKLQKQIDILEAKFTNFKCIKSQITRDEMAVLWKKTKIFISAPIYDGYSAALAEGRYVGAIPIVNNIPGNLEVIENEVNGMIVHPFTSDNLTKTIFQVLEKLDEYYENFKLINQNWISQNGLLKNDAENFTQFLNSHF